MALPFSFFLGRLIDWFALLCKCNAVRCCGLWVWSSCRDYGDLFFLSKPMCGGLMLYLFSPLFVSRKVFVFFSGRFTSKFLLLPIWNLSLLVSFLNCDLRSSTLYDSQIGCIACFWNMLLSCYTEGDLRMFWIPLRIVSQGPVCFSLISCRLL